MTDGLKKKVDFAVKLLQSIPTDDGPVEISYSGGKDSDVILELAKMAGIPYRTIYKCTTIDPSGTIKHCKDVGAEVLKPEKTFFQLIQERGVPTRFTRFCCEYLKEYKVLDRAVQGIRRCESTKRAERYKEPEICRTYPKGQKARIYLPILEWTDEDVAQFIAERGIKCHPLYYDEQGNFHVERRLGCMGCPLMSQKKRVAEFQKHPKLLKLWIRSQQIYIDNHPESKSAEFTNGSAFNSFFKELFCDNREQSESYIGGGDVPRDSD